RDDWREHVARRVLGVDHLLGDARRVVLCALGDPLLDEVDLAVRERVLALGHGGALTVLWCDLQDNLARLRLARDDARLAALSLVKQRLIARHDETALGL